LALTKQQHNIWRWPTFFLWLLLFAIGFVPEYFYHFMREWAQVPSQKALINSEFMISFAFSAYIFFFTYFRCQEAGCTPKETRVKSLQALIMALLAFFPLISLSVQWQEISVTFLKWLAWLYLYVLIIRYYFFDGPLAFRRMATILPSAWATENPDKAPTESDPEKQHPFNKPTEP